jgi:hypothetical protein
MDILVPRIGEVIGGSVRPMRLVFDQTLSVLFAPTVQCCRLGRSHPLNLLHVCVGEHCD